MKSQIPIIALTADVTKADVSNAIWTGRLYSQTY
jgi:hypothetical protein